MRNKYFILFIFIFIGRNVIQAQSMLEGRITYISSQNVYIRFESTGGISVGDTLFHLGNGRMVPLIIVRNLSSTTCMGTQFPGQTFRVSDVVKAYPRLSVNNPPPKKETTHSEEPGLIADTNMADHPAITKQMRKQTIRGSITLASYSQFSNADLPSVQRFRYQLSLNAAHIGGSRFSTESNISFRHRSGEWGYIQDNVFNGLKIYNLCLRYDLTPKTIITFGRRVNPLISNMGAVDGLQADFTFRNFSAGFLAGSRPSFKDYAPDMSLVQFGGYLAHKYLKHSGSMESSLALVEQTNAMKTDRRFLYFQHSNNLLRQLNLFGSFELDLYQKVNNTTSQKPTLSGFYVSLRYAPEKKLNLSASYDARRNIVYYETFKNFISTIIDTALRQGASMQINYHPVPWLYTGIKGGMRFRKIDLSPSRNLYGYVTYSGMDRMNFSATLSSTFLETSYLRGMIYALNTSLTLFPGKCFLGMGYQYLDYNLVESGLSQTQQLASLNLNWRFFKRTSFALNYELALEGGTRNNSIQIQLRQGFR
ncbi:MAG: hypothetical protein U0T82_16005 [Bacteroidales bacterium]